MPDAETLLVLGIFALYLQDCALLLYQDELLVVGGGTRWRVLADAGTRWSGRFLALPQVLRPDRLVFRVAWADLGRSRNGLPPQALSARLRAVRACGPVLLVLWLVAIPALLFVLPGGSALLAAGAAAYLVAAIAAALLWGRRGAIGLSRRDAAALAAEAVLCPPLAILLARKAALRVGSGGDPLALAAGLAGDERNALKSALATRMDGLLAFCEPGSERALALQAQRARIEEGLR